MEGLLRGEEDLKLIESLFCNSFNYNNPCVLFPIRHHSPACSYHLIQVIEEYKPDIILVEGPENASDLIPFIASKETVAPFCIYLSYDDKEGKINKEPNKYRAYYPFLDYSPELTAIRMAVKQDIACEFIDLSYGEKLINTPNHEKDPDPYNDDQTFTLSSYYKLLTEKTGCKSFNELWEMLFEINSCHIKTEDFVRNLFTYCYYTRIYVEENEQQINSDIVRESVMIGNIDRVMKKYKRTLVVTGGIHTITLSKYLLSGTPTFHENNRLIRIKKEESPAYLMPYSFEESDQASGYESGMVFPYFYQKIWENIIKKKKLPFEETVLYFIMQTASNIRKKQALSITDEMQSYYMSKGLANLREKKECGVFELIDSVKSSFVKAEINSFYQPALKGLYRLLTGLKVGQVDSNSGVPPIVTDFLMYCKKFRLKTNTSIKKETKLDIYTKLDHREKSRFFRQMQFLETGFCNYLKGQEDNKSTGRILLRESWEYRFTPHVQAALIQISVYGATLRVACLSLVSKQFKEEHHTAKEMSFVLLQAEQMGLSELYETLTDHLIEIIGNDMDFISIMDCFENLCSIYKKMELFEEDKVTISLSKLNQVKKLALNRSFTLLYTVFQIKNEEEDSVLEKIKYLYQYFIDEKVEEEELFLSGMESIYADTDANGGLAGISSGILLKKERLKLSESFRRFEAYIKGSDDAKKLAASFLKGFFMVAKDIIFVDDRLLLLLNEILENTDGELFLSLLPNLRLAFTYFLPFETDRIARRVSEIYGIGTDHLLTSPVLNQMDLEEAMRIDAFCAENRKIWLEGV